jgi:hypothetical protein
MDLVLAVVADAANRSDNGKLNILGVFSTLYAAQTPCQHPQMALVLGFQATALERGTQQSVTIRLVNADGQSVMTTPSSPVAVPADDTDLTPSVNLIVNLNGVRFDTFGAYRFDILVDGHVKAQIPVSVVQNV